jgi:hypothetical protein
MPDLSGNGQALKPLPACLMTKQQIGYQTRVATGPWPEDCWKYRSLDGLISGMSIIAEGIEPPAYDSNALAKRLRFSGCDGRDRVGLILVHSKRIDPVDWRSGYAHPPLAAVVIKRTLRVTGLVLSYDLDVVEADHLGRGVEYAWGLAFEWWIHFIATADLERIIRREQETGSKYDLTASIRFTADRSIAELLASMRVLQDRSLVDETRARLTSQAGRGFRPKEFYRD